jgi:hypothetical protein
VHRQVDEPQRGPLALEAVNRTLAPVAGAVVDDPEHPLGGGIGLDGHELFDETAERDDARGRLAPAHHPGPVHIVGGQVGERAAPVVLVLDAHEPGLPRRQGRVAAATGLDAGLFVRADHELVPQRLALE